jgi:hypothetical protein
VRAAPEGKVGAAVRSRARFWLEMSPYIPGHSWAAHLQLAGRKSLLQWWGD